jgi:hypothetical protein
VRNTNLVSHTVLPYCPPYCIVAHGLQSMLDAASDAFARVRECSVEVEGKSLNH